MNRRVMQSILCPLLCSSLLLASEPYPLILGAEQSIQGSSAVVLQDATPVRIRINRTISSGDAKVGENVDFEVLDEIKVGDLVVVPRSSLALGTVTEAQPKRRMGRAGKLNVNIDYLRLPNGEKVPLRGVKESQGGGRTAAMTGAMVATGIVFFPAAPLFLFMSGKDITVPKGTEITVYVNGDFTVSPPRLGQGALLTANIIPLASQVQNPVTEAAIVSPSSDSAMVAVNSVPEGAEITVDGKYVGNTPSTLRLAPGDHVVRIEKPGFAIWQRDVSTTAGSSLTIAPALEKIEASSPRKVVGISLNWQGTQQDKDSIFSFKLQFSVGDDNIIEGMFAWKAEKVPKNSVVAVGAVVNEYIRGTYDPTTRELKLAGFKLEGVGGYVDEYRLTIGVDGKSLEGKNKGGPNGKWDKKNVIRGTAVGESNPD